MWITLKTHPRVERSTRAKCLLNLNLRKLIETQQNRFTNKNFNLNRMVSLRNATFVPRWAVKFNI